MTPHGGVTRTSFSSWSAQSSASDPALTDYDDLVKSTGATDGRGQLRYLVGDDARGFVKARREMIERESA